MQRQVMSGSDLQAAEHRAAETALALIRERFESGRVPDHMHYHDSVHTRGVIDRARAIGVALRMDERELLLTVIAAAWHDSVQRWSAVPGEDGALMRRRRTGRDEVASAHEASEAMAELGPAFSAEEQGIVASAILATIPGWDGEAATVSQPFLVDHPVVRTVALADLGAAGMDADMFCRDGPALFAEENIDVMQAVAGARRASDIPEDRQRAYRQRYLNWLRFQPQFAQGRRTRLSGELDGLTEDTRERVLKLFCRFEESIIRTEAASASAEALDFASLMRQLDPRAFPDET